MPRAEYSRQDTKRLSRTSTRYDAKKPSHARTRKSIRRKPPLDSDAGVHQLKLNDLKKRLRDLTRLMKHRKNMHAGERQYKERELAALKDDLTTLLYQKRRKELISKYHMVRFFERRKAERSLKQAQKTAAAAPVDSPDREVLKDTVHEAEVSLNYTLYYPLEKKYLSLYNSKGKDECGAGFKSPAWYEVESAMSQNSLQTLRDQKHCLDTARNDTAKTMGRFEEARQENQIRQLRNDEDTNEVTSQVGNDGEDVQSDGGFFEDT